MVLDIKWFREGGEEELTPEDVREIQRQRHKPLEHVETVIAADEAWRKGRVMA